MGELKAPYILVTGLYCALIFYLSSLSDPPDPGFHFPGLDKVVHLILYAGLAATVSVGIYRSNETVKQGVQFWVPVVFALLYGLTDEIHQIFVPNRSFEWADLLADLCGALLVQALFIGFLNHQRPNQP